MNYEKLPKTISAEELLSTPLPPVKWIIPNLLPAGLALFAGPSKAGKSWLTLWLCLQVAQGKPMWGREIEPHTVFYTVPKKILADRKNAETRRQTPDPMLTRGKTMEDIDPRPSFKTVAAQLRKAAARSAERAVNATRKEER